MVRLFGTACDTDLASLRQELPTQWLRAWDAHHKTGKNEKAACLSLTALLLLRRAGADGTLAYEDGGRPYFCDRICDFSITHTQNHAFCAFIEDEKVPMRIGIDAEELDRPDLLKIEEMAARWFTENEQKLFAQAPTQETFLRIWTKKEAYAKYTGEGMRSLSQIDTETIENAARVRFFEQKWGEILITLCAPSGTNPPSPIQINEQE